MWTKLSWSGRRVQRYYSYLGRVQWQVVSTLQGILVAWNGRWLQGWTRVFEKRSGRPLQGAQTPPRMVAGQSPGSRIGLARRCSCPGTTKHSAGALFKAIHWHALSLKRDTYIDPNTGYSVFTQAYLQRRPCCGNRCRQRPHEHVNVPHKNQDKIEDDKDKSLEWWLQVLQLREIKSLLIYI